MSTLIYPTAAELKAVEQVTLPTLTEKDDLFSILPIENINSDLIMWERKDNFVGMQPWRGVNGQVKKTNRIGSKRFIMSPGYFAGYKHVDEQEMLRRAGFADLSAKPIDIGDLVLECQNGLLHERLTRIKHIGWTLLTTGTFSITDSNGQVVHSDTFDFQDFNASVGWGTAATATPLADFRAVQLLSRGNSVSFGPDATAYMNRTTWNQMMANTNTSDIFGKRTAGLGTINSFEDVNRLLMGEGLPSVKIYDKTYQNDSDVTTLFIPTGYIVVVGKRDDGQAIGSYVMTRNANNPGFAPGAYTGVVDSLSSNKPVPRQIEVIDCHNGGPKIEYPTAICVMDVT